MIYQVITVEMLTNLIEVEVTSKEVGHIRHITNGNRFGYDGEVPKTNNDRFKCNYSDWYLSTDKHICKTCKYMYLESLKINNSDGSTGYHAKIKKYNRLLWLL